MVKLSVQKDRKRGKLLKMKNMCMGQESPWKNVIHAFLLLLPAGFMGLMVHTSYASDIAEALQKYQCMKEEINDILKDDDHKEGTLTQKIERFVNRYS